MRLSRIIASLNVLGFRSYAMSLTKFLIENNLPFNEFYNNREDFEIYLSDKLEDMRKMILNE